MSIRHFGKAGFRVFAFTGRIVAALFVGGVAFVQAEALSNPVAVFSGLDKITATITSFPVAVNDTRLFGRLEVTPRVCYSRPPTEEPKTTSFVEIDEILENGDRKRVFSGWMFAESPGLHGLEHPVFDVWLTGCRNNSNKSDAITDDTETEEMSSDDIPTDTD